MKPIRVAQVMGYMNGGGVEQMVMNYYRHIDRHRVQFDLIVCEGSKMVPVAEVEELGGHVLYVPAYKNVLGFHRALTELCREHRWDIVHSHMNALSVISLASAAEAGVPIRIAHSHNTGGAGERVRNLAKNMLKRYSNRYPTHRLACSRAAGEWLFGRSAEFDVVPNAIELERFKDAYKYRQEMRAYLDLKESEFVLGHVGRFMTQKNHKYLLEVFANLLKVRPESRLLLVGAGELKKDVCEQAKHLEISDKVIFLGQRDDVERIYAACDVFCLPSLYEGLGIVAVEAQAAGLKCLISDNVPEEVDVTGQVRFLSLGRMDDWVMELAKIEVGTRVGARVDQLSKYDIYKAAPRLLERYEDYVRLLPFDRNLAEAH